MELLQPTKNHRVTQVFGDRKNVYGGIGHTGTDFGAQTAGQAGDDVLVVDQAKVIQVAYDADGYGNYVDLQLENWTEQDHSPIKVTCRYAHLVQAKVAVGDRVHMGDVVGFMGNTGWSDAAHLHFELRINGKVVDPLPYLTLSYNEFMNELQKLRQDHEDFFAAYGENNGKVNDKLAGVDGRLDKQSDRINAAVEDASDSNKVLRGRVEKTIGKELEKLTAEEREAIVGVKA